MKKFDKERLFEMMNKVNKINLNERFISKEDLENVAQSADMITSTPQSDKIEGGLADDKSVMDFNRDQILMGIGVEMEHTSDPRIALEIAMDHLMEDPEYYSKLKAMEAGGCDDGVNDGQTDSVVSEDINNIPSEQEGFDDFYDETETQVKESFRNIRIRGNELPTQIPSFIGDTRVVYTLNSEMIEVYESKGNQIIYETKYVYVGDNFQFTIDVPVVVDVGHRPAGNMVVFENEVFFNYENIDLHIEKK